MLIVWLIGLPTTKVLIDSLNYPLIDWLLSRTVNRLIDLPNYPLIDWLIDWLNERWIGWLFDWLIDWSLTVAAAHTIAAGVDPFDALAVAKAESSKLADPLGRINRFVHHSVGFGKTRGRGHCNGEKVEAGRGVNCDGLVFGHQTKRLKLCA